MGFMVFRSRKTAILIDSDLAEIGEGLSKVSCWRLFGPVNKSYVYVRMSIAVVCGMSSEFDVRARSHAQMIPHFRSARVHIPTVD
jgi:hypothetical protein